MNEGHKPDKEKPLALLFSRMNAISFFAIVCIILGSFGIVIVSDIIPNMPDAFSILDFSRKLSSPFMLILIVGTFHSILTFLKPSVKLDTNQSSSRVTMPLRPMGGQLTESQSSAGTAQYSDVKCLEARIADLEKGTVLTDEFKQSLARELRESVDDSFKQELLYELKEKYSEEASVELSREAMAEIFNASRSRILKEIDMLEKKGSLNLAVGSTICVVGLLFFPYDAVDFKGLLSYDVVVLRYLPRLSFIVFIQLVGFFYLRLYRDVLSTIKYYQNEITNIEMQYIAVNAGIMTKNESRLTSIVLLLCKTDRNITPQGNDSLGVKVSAKNEQGMQDEIISAIKGALERITHEMRGK